MRKREGDYNSLQTQVVHIEHNLNILLKEKERGEIDYRMRLDSNSKTIQKSKEEQDSLRILLHERERMHKKLTDELYNYNAIIEERQREIIHLRN